MRPKKYNFYKADYDKINSYLSNINWENVFAYTNNIDHMYRNFLEVIHKSIQLYTYTNQQYLQQNKTTKTHKIIAKRKTTALQNFKK